jgi:hypothetical protein
MERTCECGAPGKHKDDYWMLVRCDACEVPRLQKQLEARRENIMRLVDALTPADYDKVDTWDQATERCVAEVKRLKADLAQRHGPGGVCMEWNGAPVPIVGDPLVPPGLVVIDGVPYGPSPLQKLEAARALVEANACNPEEMMALLATPVVKVRGEDSNKTKTFVSPDTYRALSEAGPGLAAKYPDATPAAKPETDIVLSVDDGRWDD